MEVTRTKTVTRKGSETIEIVKLKTGDTLPTHRLPKESTNLTDALKYLILRKEWIRVWKSILSVYTAAMMGPK